MEKLKFLVLGANGQLGREFVKQLTIRGFDFTALTKKECDISSLSQVIVVFEQVKPSVVLNCAAYNLVDKAEEDYLRAYAVNAVGARNLAYASKRYGAVLVHFSTDYVFDGEKRDGLYTEEDTPNPLNEYGKSKLAGEVYIQEETDRYLIFRVSWLYGEGKQNFIYKLLSWAKNNRVLKVACDEFSVPTSTRTVVEVSLEAVEMGLTGLYHLVNTGYASRFEWAKEVFKVLNRKDVFVYPCSRSEFLLPARRPRFSAMSASKIFSLIGKVSSDWKKELVDFLRDV